MLTDTQQKKRLAGAELSGRDLPEWIITNGRGGFTSGTMNQTLTRRYHGLLVAAVKPPVQRYVLLAKLDTTVFIDGRRYELDTNEYDDARHPQGFQYLIHFDPHPRPTWRWELGSTVIEQSLEMIEGLDAVRIRFKIVEGKQPVELAIRPLCTCRHFHHLTSANDQGNPFIQPSDQCVYLAWEDDQPAWMIHHDGRFDLQADWYYGFELAWERARGYDHKQDLFSPGILRKSINPGDDGFNMLVLTREADEEHSPVLKMSSQMPSGYAGPSLDADESFKRALTKSAAQFIVRRDDDLRTVIAGYPWFGDWGRDTFIALPGLCLVNKRFDDARRIIEMFSRTVDRGMIPNRFPPYGEPPQYNTCDATLWYVYAIGRFFDYTDNWTFVRDICYPVITQILAHHFVGTRHNIHAAEDGLLVAGEEGYALTWMDAKVGDRVFTPRIGKPVEINALWYNALRIAADFAKRLNDGERARQWTDAAERCRESFNNRFWNENTNCLSDVVDCDGRVGDRCARIRPNQLLAISLRYAVLDQSRWKSVVDVCQEKLLTPMGMRTLAQEDPAYIGHYGGTVDARDAAYHQGTVWPWLMGPFISAYVRAHGPGSAVRARSFLENLREHVYSCGINGISEIADGDFPHRPEGCPWQAWSVAEVLRVLHEDLAD